MIWERTVEPRKVYLRGGCSTTPVPAILHTCREARALGLYQKASTYVQDLSPLDTQYPYFWVKFELNTIAIDKDEHVENLELIASEIQHLQFEQEGDGTYRGEAFWSLGGHRELAMFKNVKEIFNVCHDGLGSFGEVLDIVQFPCGPDNVYLTERLDEGVWVSAIELDRQFKQYVQRRGAAMQAEYEAYWAARRNEVRS